MTRKIAFGMALSMLLSLCACGYSPGTRAVTGGLLGAGAGAGVAAVHDQREGVVRSNEAGGPEGAGVRLGRPGWQPGRVVRRTDRDRLSRKRNRSRG